MLQCNFFAFNLPEVSVSFFQSPIHRFKHQSNRNIIHTWHVGSTQKNVYYTYPFALTFLNWDDHFGVDLSLVYVSVADLSVKCHYCQNMMAIVNLIHWYDCSETIVLSIDRSAARSKLRSHMKYIKEMQKIRKLRKMVWKSHDIYKCINWKQ